MGVTHPASPPPSGRPITVIGSIKVELRDGQLTGVFVVKAALQDQDPACVLSN
jgi:hypothetical protein